jgi:DNA repair exonuclease SbcCD ATPase subunit
MTVKVHIENFQSLEDVEFVIDGLTVITGANNTGKSAVMRALRGAFQNTRGTAFIRHGADSCSVAVEFDDGQTLKWMKGRKRTDKPTYIVNGGTPIHPGQSVPEEVRALGVAPINAGNRELWPQVAPQFNQIFLLDQPGSVMAEAIADVERVGYLNDALRQSSSDRRKANNLLVVRRSDEIRLKGELEQFEGLDEVVLVVTGIEEAIALAARIQSALESLSVLRDRRVRAAAQVEGLEPITQVVIPEDSLFTSAQGLQDEQAELIVLRDRRARISARVQKMAGIEDVELDVDMGVAENLVEARAVLENLRTRRSKILDRMGTYDTELVLIEVELQKLDGSVTEMLGGLESCPVCGQAGCNEVLS